MKLTRLTTVVLSLLLTSFLPRAGAGTIDLPQYGFEIDALDAEPGAATTTAIMMFLPVSEGFAANINVNIQPYKGTIKEYAALSKGQFSEMKWKVVSDEQKGEDEWRAEYAATTKSGDLHFYARALKKGDRVYLVTATAKESQWASVQAKLRKHVDSLKVK
jgi:PsbP